MGRPLPFPAPWVREGPSRRASQGLGLLRRLWGGGEGREWGKPSAPFGQSEI